MPIYEFECTCCPARFELKRGFHDEKPVPCPSCGGKTRRVFSSVPIIFKGSGFYVTDSRGGSSFTSAPSPGDETKASTAEAKSSSPEPKAAAVETKTGKSEAKVASAKKKN